MDDNENAGTPQRPPSYAELLVDSMDRYYTSFPLTQLGISSSSHWQTQFSQNVLYGYFTRLAITQIQFFWNLPTIITGYNDTFDYMISGGISSGGSVTIPQGYYTTATLASAIQTAINAQSPSDAIRCTYDTLNGAFSLTSLNAATNIAPNAVASNVNSKTRFLSTVGFINTGSLALAKPYIGTTPTMYATRFVDIASAYLTKYQRVKDNTTLKSPTISNIIARVYATAPNTRTTFEDASPQGSTPFVVCIDYNTPKYIKWSPEEALGNFDLTLYDEFGSVLPFDLKNYRYGCEYQLTILASET